MLFSLEQLLSKSIAVNEKTPINSVCLFHVLQALLKQLNLHSMQVDIDEMVVNYPHVDPPLDTSTPSGEIRKQSDQATLNGLVSSVRHIEAQMAWINAIPDNKTIMGNTDKKSSENSLAVYSLCKINTIEKRLDAVEQNVTKVSSLVDDVLSTLQRLSKLESDFAEFKATTQETSQCLLANLTSLNQKIVGIQEVLGDADKSRRIFEEGKLRAFEQDMTDLRERARQCLTVDEIWDLDFVAKWPQFEAIFRGVAVSENGRTLSLPSSQSLMEDLRCLGDSAHSYPAIKDQMTNIELGLKTKASLDDIKKLRDVPDDLLLQLQVLKENLTQLHSWKTKLENNQLADMDKRSRASDQLVADLKHSNDELVSSSVQVQANLQELLGSYSLLEQRKASKEEVVLEVSKKADKESLDRLVETEVFDAMVSKLDETIKEITSQLEDHDNQLNSRISWLTDEVVSKSDKSELDNLKRLVDKRIVELEDSIPTGIDITVDPEESAGFKKGYSCIACDRPLIAFPGSHPKNPFSYPCWPVSRSRRPYTSLDLDVSKKLASNGYHRECFPYNQRPSSSQAKIRVSLSRRSDSPPRLRSLKGDEKAQSDGAVYSSFSNEQSPRPKSALNARA